MSVDSRLKKLETRTGINARYKWLCVYGSEVIRLGLPIRIQPYTPAEGGKPGAKPFTVANEQELNEFGARPDVDLYAVRMMFVNMGAI